MDTHNSEQPVDDCKWASRSKTVERVATANLPTTHGDFKIAGYRSLTSDEEFVVLYTGELDAHVPTLVRIHSQCLTGDVFGSIKCDCGPQLHRAMDMIQAEGRGAIVYQQQEGRGIGIINKIRAYALQDEGAQTRSKRTKNSALPSTLASIRQCAEILFDLGLCKVRVISNNPDKLNALEEAGLRSSSEFQSTFRPRNRPLTTSKQRRKKWAI